MTDRLSTDLGTRLRKWPSSSSESLSNVQEKEPIPLPKMLDDVVLYLRRFIIDPKNCSCPSVPLNYLFPDFQHITIARYLFSEYTGRLNLLSKLRRCFSREKNKTKQNKNGLIIIGVLWLCTLRLGESVNTFLKSSMYHKWSFMMEEGDMYLNSWKFASKILLHIYSVFSIISAIRCNNIFGERTAPITATEDKTDNTPCTVYLHLPRSMGLEDVDSEWGKWRKH